MPPAVFSLLGGPFHQRIKAYVTVGRCDVDHTPVVRVAWRSKAMPAELAKRRSALVLLVADLLHPLHRLAVERLLDSDVGHGGGWGGAMPMLLARREAHDIAGANFLDRPALALRPAAARGDHE